MMFFEKMIVFNKLYADCLIIFTIKIFLKFSKSVIFIFDQSMKSAKENLLQQQDSEVENIHTFSLKPLHQKDLMSKAVVVDFTPQISESKTVSIMPRLNQSKDCFQPLFQSPYIKNLLKVNGQIPQIYMTMRSGPSITPISQRSSVGKCDGFKPRPTSKYCQLCKQKFNEDYLDVVLYLIKHIKHTVHVNNLKANSFQKYIQSLVQDFKKKSKRQRPPSLNSKDEASSGKAKKKVKTQNLLVDFPYKTVISTESTNNSSATLDLAQKKQKLHTLSE